MFYQLKPTFEAVQEKPAEGVPWVEVITQQEMDSQVTQHPYLARSLRHGHSCKAELFDHCAAGALLVPRKEHSPRSGHSFAFLLTADHLTFVDDTVTPYNKFEGTGRGFTFSDINAHDMVWVLREAVDLYFNNKKAWRGIQKEDMTADFSWNSSARQYLEIYQRILGW